MHARAIMQKAVVQVLMPMEMPMLHLEVGLQQKEGIDSLLEKTDVGHTSHKVML